ncbi:leucine-rich repeat transmembrane protein FLRT3-like [Malaya genurostris]|uniref:leucine-rich repeat transmembrane protein FLRT3-like n=1 Tax=Malaya genurostris TaxID=325434 RepID=UPI0026F40220|nr:leucine-rich repeat transmembrane protein FLRT3-like [Malaya genurostris]
MIKHCLLLVGLALFISQTSAIAGVSSAISYSCTRDESTKCVIPNIIGDSAEIQLPDLSNKTILQLKSGKIDQFNERFNNQLGTVTKLHIGMLGIKTFVLHPALIEIRLEGNEITSFRLESDTDGYKVEILDLSKNQLTGLDGFEKMSSLKELNLKSNNLEMINMKTFETMTTLSKLDISGNRISTILATSSLPLPVLDSISLAGNKLEKLDVTNWEFESLTSLDVSSNDLVHISGLHDRFPSLTEIFLSHNAWYCTWLDETLANFTSSYVAVKDSDKDCEGLSPSNICCLAEHEANVTTYDESFKKLDQLEQKQSTLLQELDSKIRKFETEQSDRLSGVHQQLEDLLKKEQIVPSAALGNNTDQETLTTVKMRLNEIESNVENEIRKLDKQNLLNSGNQRKLGIAIIELKRSLERESKKMIELQSQFTLLKDYVISKLKKQIRLEP